MKRAPHTPSALHSCVFTTALHGTASDETLTQTVAGLSAEGFGVLVDLGVRDAMIETLGADMLPDGILWPG